MARHSGPMVLAAFVLIGLGGWGIMRIPTGFLPIEDQGYLLVSVQLPDGASLARTEDVLADVTRIGRTVPGVAQVLTVAGVSALDNSASLSSAGMAYVLLKDWGARGKGEDLASIYANLNRALDAVPEAQSVVLPPPPIQGIGNSSGFTMMAELRNGSFDYGELQSLTRAMIARANDQSGLTRTSTSFRAATPQLRLDIDRVKAATLHVALGDVFQALSGYLGSSYVNQITKFGRVFQVYVQAESQFRATPADIDKLWVRSSDGAMIPLGTIVSLHRTVAPALVSLYNLYPAATIVGQPAPGFSSGQSMALMEQIANATLPPGTGFDWTAMSYQEKLVGSQIVLVFGLAMLLVYLVLAGQYESWYAPLSVILAVPLALLGPVVVLEAAGAANNLYTQIGLILLIALSAKNAILIVEVARERRAAGAGVIESAVEAAQARFRPILMTSFAFILGMLPLVFATGAGASARRSIGVAVVSGMIASTCLAVLFVPSFFVLIQRLEEWRTRRKQPQPASIPAE